MNLICPRCDKLGMSNAALYCRDPQCGRVHPLWFWAHQEEPHRLCSRETRERLAILYAQLIDKCFVYIDDDGCEVTATPGGRTFYNAFEWY